MYGAVPVPPSTTARKLAVDAPKQSTSDWTILAFNSLGSVISNVAVCLQPTLSITVYSYWPTVNE